MLAFGGLYAGETLLAGDEDFVVGLVGLFQVEGGVLGVGVVADQFQGDLFVHVIFIYVYLCLINFIN